MSDAPAPAQLTSEKSASPLVRRTAISSLAVMGSRVLGLVREQIFAFFFGASLEYDAFLTAFRVPNLLRDLLAEGALSAAFVSVFSRELQAGGKARAFAVANTVWLLLAATLSGIVALGIWWAPQLVHALAMGFDADKLALTVQLTRLMFPFILFVALAALAMGMLNALGFYGLPQSASTFFNLTSVGIGLGAAYWLAPTALDPLAHGQASLTHAAVLPITERPLSRAMVGMALGTLAGGLVQWWVQIPLLWRQGFRPWPRVPISDPALRQILRLLGPAVVGAAAVQMSVFINSNFASLLGDRPISWLAYSFRLMQFPIGVFGVAIMTASLPTLAKQAGAADHAGFGDSLTQALELVLCLTLPATAGLLLLGEPLLRLLFEHGRFGAEDTRACAQALCAYALGLPGYSALKVLQPAFLARGDAKTPMYVTLLGVLLSLGSNALLLLYFQLGHVGLALSTSLLASGSTLALLLLLERQRPTLQRAKLARQCARIAAATAGMGLPIYGAQILFWHLLPPGLRRAGAMGAALELALLAPLAVALYWQLADRLGVLELAKVRALVRRRRA